MMLTETMLHRLWPHGNSKIPGLIAGMVATSADVFGRYGLDSPLVVAHFMAQVSHECGAGTEVVENLNYSAQRISEVWPSRFPSAYAASAYAHNPEKLANKVYGGRMGNDQPGDGWKFRGRGASQTTGREGYEKLGRQVALDLLSNPDLVNDPMHFLECGAADFIICGCLAPAEQDDIRTVTHRLNGGYIGLGQRQEWLARWKSALAAEGLDVHGGPERHPGDGLRFGDRGFEVTMIQERLIQSGYALGKADGIFGPATRAAVLTFQADNGLPTTGIVDPATRDALVANKPRPLAEERVSATAKDLRDAGSVTVKTADTVNTMAKAGVAIGGAEAADKSGVLDQARDWFYTLGGPHEAIDVLKDLVRWLDQHLWIALLVGGVAAWYFGRRIIAERLADHRSGANMRR